MSRLSVLMKAFHGATMRPFRVSRVAQRGISSTNILRDEQKKTVSGVSYLKDGAEPPLLPDDQVRTSDTAVTEAIHHFLWYMFF